MIHTLKLLLIVALISLSNMDLRCQGFPAMPEDIGFVNDMAGLMSIDERDLLNIRMMEFYDTTGIIVMVVTTADFGGIDPANYTAGLIRHWGIGNALGEKAVMMVVKGRTKEMPPFAGISYNSLIAGGVDKRVLDEIASEVVMPLLKRDKYYSAIYQGAESVKNALTGHYTSKPNGGINLPGNLNILTLSLLFILVILITRLIIKHLKSKKTGHP